MSLSFILSHIPHPTSLLLHLALFTLPAVLAIHSLAKHDHRFQTLSVSRVILVNVRKPHVLPLILSPGPETPSSVIPVLSEPAPPPPSRKSSPIYKFKIRSRSNIQGAVFGAPTAVQVAARELIAGALARLLGPITQCFWNFAVDKGG